MNARYANAERLYDPGQKEIALLAFQARMDTIHGGAHALVEAKESGDPELLSVVTDVYSLSTGRPSPDWEAWECGECGSVFLGREVAEECCSFEVPEFEEEEE